MGEGKHSIILQINLSLFVFCDIFVWFCYQSDAGHIPRENHNSKRHMHPNVNCSAVDMEATYMSINKRMDKEDVVHIYKGMLLSHNHEQNLVICRDMVGLRCGWTLQSEVSQKEKNKYCILVTYMWNIKKWYNLICKTEVETQI